MIATLTRTSTPTPTDPAEDRFSSGDLARHYEKNTKGGPRAIWRVIATADGGSVAVPDWEAIDADRRADGADAPGVTSRDSLLSSGDATAIWASRDHPHFHPRERFTVVLTPNGSRIQTRAHA